MSGYAVVGWLDDLGFPTGGHARLLGTEETLCGLPGGRAGSTLYSRIGAVTCPACLEALEQREALVIEEPVEVRD